MKLRKSRTAGTLAGEEVREDLLPPGMAVEPYMVLESVCKKIQPTFSFLAVSGNIAFIT